MEIYPKILERYVEIFPKVVELTGGKPPGPPNAKEIILGGPAPRPHFMLTGTKPIIRGFPWHLPHFCSF